MSNRKKAQPKETLSQPFKFADFDELINHGQQLIASNGYSDGVSKLLRWTNKTYVPAYSLGNIIGADRLNTLVTTGTNSQTMLSHPYYISRLTDISTIKTYDNMWKNKSRGAIMLALLYGQNHLEHTITKYERVFGYYYDNFVNNRQFLLSPTLPAYYTGTGAASLVRRFMLGEGADGARIVSKKITTGDFANVTYFANRYFLGYLKPYSTNPTLRTFNNGFVGSNTEMTNSVYPLVTLVMKRTDVGVVRAQWLGEELSDASMFELWVDKSLDAEDSQHPIRTSYVRSIRNPLAKLGIKVVIKDDLYKECFAHMEIPKFKTLKEEKAFIEEKTEQILNKERRRLGVQRTPATPAVAPTAALADFPF